MSISLLFINLFIYLFIYLLVSLLRSRGKGIVYSPQWSEIVVLNGESRDFTASASCEFLLPLHGSVFEDNEAFGDDKSLCYLQKGSIFTSGYYPGGTQ